MNLVRSILSVFRFEWRRSLTVPRMAWWFLLTAFPPTLLGLVRLNEGQPEEDELLVVHFVVAILCAGVVSVLGVFLWATPWISAELEGRSWVYVAVRPHGALAALLGKYLVAVTWTLPAGMTAAALGVVILSPTSWLELIWVQWRLVFLSCLSYGAIFSLIGVLIPNRAMVVSIFYAIFFEVVLSSAPAAVNLLTAQFRLRCLFVRWVKMDESQVGENPVFLAYFGDEPASWHVIVLLSMTAALLCAAILALRWKEFTVDETAT